MAVLEMEHFRHERDGLIWTMNVPIGNGEWSQGSPPSMPSQRLAKLIHAVEDFTSTECSHLKILDLGCLEGAHAIEFALRGADVLGIEGREQNLAKCMYAKERLGLNNLKFRLGDVTKLSVAETGVFDVVNLSGLLYHISAADQGPLLQFCADATRRLLIIDTHISVESKHSFEYMGDSYSGRDDREHSERDGRRQKENRPWASLENNVSFWITKPSLVNLLGRLGFGSVYETLLPAMPPLVQPELKDRTTLCGIKRSPASVAGTTFESPPWSECDLAGRSDLLQRIQNDAFYRCGERLRSVIRRVLGR